MRKSGNSSCRSKRKHVAASPQTPVSSRGCSRMFIICFLSRILEYVKTLRGHPEFPFSTRLINHWIALAQSDCVNEAIKEDFGGVPFAAGDPTSYWTAPHQYVTWWKNNVERRKKFHVLKSEAIYKGEDSNLKKRARFCSNAVVLVVNIRNHFSKYRSPPITGAPGPQYKIPYLQSWRAAIQTTAHPPDSSCSEEELLSSCSESSGHRGAEARCGGCNSNRLLGGDSMGSMEWEMETYFNDGYSDCIETVMLDQMPPSFQGESIEAESMDELACVNFMRSTTALRCSSSLSSSLSSSINSSSDCDDSCFSPIGDLLSPLASPFELEKSTGAAVTGTHDLGGKFPLEDDQDSLSMHRSSSAPSLPVYEWEPPSAEFAALASGPQGVGHNRPRGRSRKLPKRIMDVYEI